MQFSRLFDALFSHKSAFDDGKSHTVNDIELTNPLAPMEKSIEEGNVAQNVRSTLRWDVPRSSKRVWWTALAGVCSLVVLVFFTGVPKYTSQSEALLDTTLNATLGFQKIFVINMPKSTDRRDRMQLAASFSGLEVEFMEAVTIDDLDRDAIPPIPAEFEDEEIAPKILASWRSHVNAIHAIVQQNLGSALILEDDADWDFRIKEQLRRWAKTSRQLIQPLKNEHHQYLDPTYFKDNATRYNELISSDSRYTEWDVTSPAAPVLEPTESAYGDLARWDLLWLGHCGQKFAYAGSECPKTPLGRVTSMDDETVAETQWFRNWVSGDEYAKTYQNHTRVTHWSCGQVCNTAYAMSNQGAKKFLYDFGVRVFRGMSDAVLRKMCEGVDAYELRTCLSVSPPLFNQYTLDPHRKYAYTANIRWSVNGNLRKLANGIWPLRDYFKNGEDKYTQTVSTEDN